MAYRQIVLLFSLGIVSNAAAAEDSESCEEQVRKTIGLVRPAGREDASDVHFLPARPLAVESVHYELRVGGEPVDYVLLRCVPGDDSVAVQHLDVITCSPTWEGRPPADQRLRLREGRIPLSSYKMLLKLLDACVRVELRDPRARRRRSPGLSGRRPNTGVRRDLRWRLSVGRSLTTQGRISQETEVLFDTEGPISEKERAFLWIFFIQRQLDEWRLLKEPSPNSRFWDGLAADLKVVRRGWRRDLRLAAISLAGGAAFGPWVEKLEPSSPWVRLAQDQVRVLAASSVSSTPPVELMEMMGSRRTLVRILGADILKRVYPATYRAHLSRAFARAPDGPAKLKALDEYEGAFGIDEDSLRKALDDESPMVRAAAAARLADREALYRILDECSSDTWEGLQARLSAIRTLGWQKLTEPSDKQLGPRLVALAADKVEDVRLRKLACEALGWIMYEAGADTLVRVLGEGRQEKPTYLAPIGRAEVMEVRYRLWDDPRIGAARGLGVLRARSAVAALVRCLKRTGPEETSLREAIGDALGYIGDQTARGVLEAMRKTDDPENAQRWDYAIGVLAGLGRHDGRWLLEQWWPEAPGFLPRLLAQEFTRKELSRLLEVVQSNRKQSAWVQEALEMKGVLEKQKR